MTRPEFVAEGAACIGAYWMADVNPSDQYSLRTARMICAACPVLAACRQWSLTADVAGVVAGLTEAEREEARARRHIQVERVYLSDLTPARDITPGIVDDLPVTTTGQLHSTVRDLILRMTAAGISAQDIVDRLQHPQVTEPETVDYIRRTYMRGRSYVET